MQSDSLIQRLCKGNKDYQKSGSVELRLKTAKEGQHPYAIVICCSDSRVIPEQIFSAGIGELFVIRVAGNVLDNHQLGSIEYAASHLGCKLIIMLGHTGCGAVAAALEGHSEGFVASITDDIRKAIGDEKNPNEACRLNVLHGVARIREEFSKADVRGAIYEIESGEVSWLEDSNSFGLDTMKAIEEGRRIARDSSIQGYTDMEDLKKTLEQS